MQKQRSQQRQRRPIEQAYKPVEVRELARRAVEVDYEGDQRPCEEMIGERGATLLEQHEQPYDQIYDPYESHVKAEAEYAETWRRL